LKRRERGWTKAVPAGGQPYMGEFSHRQELIFRKLIIASSPPIAGEESPWPRWRRRICGRRSRPSMPFEGRIRQDFSAALRTGLTRSLYGVAESDMGSRTGFASGRHRRKCGKSTAWPDRPGTRGQQPGGADELGDARRIHQLAPSGQGARHDRLEDLRTHEVGGARGDEQQGEPDDATGEGCARGTGHRAIRPPRRPPPSGAPTRGR